MIHINAVFILVWRKIHYMWLDGSAGTLWNRYVSEMHLYPSMYFKAAFTHACTLHIEVADKFCDECTYSPSRRREMWSIAFSCFNLPLLSALFYLILPLFVTYLQRWTLQVLISSQLLKYFEYWMYYFLSSLYMHKHSVYGLSGPPVCRVLEYF